MFLGFRPPNRRSPPRAPAPAGGERGPAPGECVEEAPNSTFRSTIALTGVVAPALIVTKYDFST